ncbi:MAG: hypothetical protein KDM81_14710, partial [Verrucomicrobiae bacterium]|nr:hypothetical protein [Verrucomicrobiae bacterium]
VEATIAYVVRLNAAPTRDADPQWWGQTGIVDARSAAGDDSWGCVVNPAGAVGFGAGNPDQTLYSAGESLIDDKFHVVIQTWGGGAMSLQVDDQDPVVSTSGVSELPRGATGMALGGLATGEPEARFAGQLAEVRFYDESLSAVELDTVRRELVEKHGLGGGGINVPPFEIIARGINGEGQFYVTIESVAGANYRLLHKASLSEADWTEVASGRAGGATLTLTDPRGAAPGGYYQVVADATTGGELEPFMILRGGVSGPNEAYLVVQSVAGHTYKLLKQAALGGPDWVEVDSVTAAGEETILTDSEASTASAFYRVLGE